MGDQDNNAPAPVDGAGAVTGEPKRDASATTTEPSFTDRFLAYVVSFLFAHECAFEEGHFGDYKFVRTEEVHGDNGGLTKWGIDRASHPQVDIAALDEAAATRIYWDDDWAAVQGDSWPVGYGEVLCDIHVNGGNWATTLQRALNLRGAGLKVDGEPGPQTHAAAVQFGRLGLISLLCLRQHRYEALAESPQFQPFLAGWTNRNRDLARFVGLDPNVVS